MADQLVLAYACACDVCKLALLPPYPAGPDSVRDNHRSTAAGADSAARHHHVWCQTHFRGKCGR